MTVNGVWGAAAVLAAAVSLLLGGCGTSRSQDPFTAGIDRGPTPATLHMMSRLLVDQRRPEQAEHVLRGVIGEHPDYLPAYVELAELLARQRREAEALGLLSSVTGVHGHDPVLHNNLGVLYLQKRELERALESFSRALSMDPGEARYWANKGLALALLGRRDEAVDAYAHAVPPARAYWNVAVVQQSRGEPQEAADLFRRALALDPEMAAPADVSSGSAGTRTASAAP